MAKKNIETAVARDVAADVAAELLGSPAKMTKAAAKLASRKGKAAKGKGKAAKASAEAVGTPAKASGKAAKGKVPAKAEAAGKAAKGKRGRPSPYADSQRIVVVDKDRKVRADSYIGKVWALVLKSKTIADYKRLRAEAKMEGEMGGLFAAFVKAGHVQVK